MKNSISSGVAIMLRFVLIRKGGFTLIEIMIAVVIIGVLLSVAMPGFTKARNNSRLKSCLKNMQVISWAKEEFAIEAHKSEGDAVDLNDLVPIYIRNDPECPAQGVYTPMPIGENVDCTIEEHEP